MDFLIQLTNIDQLVSAFQQAPSTVTPILQRALLASQAVLAKYTTRSTVPFITGFLLQSFSAYLEPGILHWYPTASYARFVEFGTAPHVIEPKNGRALYWPGAQHPVARVNHPGTKANPYMERIIAAATPDVNATFNTALQQIAKAIAAA
jgi:hypothetical protein